MSIIVEGMDNTGKTTLTELLGQAFGLPIIKGGGPPKTADETIQRILSFLLLDPPAIFDRHPLISEYVYGRTLRENIFQKPLTWEYYIQRLLRNDPLIIYCRPPLANILSFSTDKPQMEGIIENATKLVDAYGRIMSDLLTKRFKVYVYAYTDQTEPRQLYAVVSAYLKARREL